MLLTSDIAVTYIRNDVSSLQKEIQPISNIPQSCRNGSESNVNYPRQIIFFSNWLEVYCSLKQASQQNAFPQRSHSASATTPSFLGFYKRSW